MNKNLDLTKILKVGDRIYSPLLGTAEVISINESPSFPIKVAVNRAYISNLFTFTKEGFLYNEYDNTECIIFPSKENRDWSTFKREEPQYKFKPFDKVIVRFQEEDEWVLSFFSHIDSDKEFPFCTINCHYWKYCLPYEGHEHLVGSCDA